MTTKMRVGTKSLLFGPHCLLLHPWFVAVAWWKLYGLPYDPRLWLAFFVHDLGYWHKPNMDGPEGEDHPRLGANVLYRLTGQHKWWEFCMYHSRFSAASAGKPVSRLGVADKLALVLTPAWLFLPLARWTGELVEYMTSAAIGKHAGMGVASPDKRQWYANTQNYLRRWVEEHRNG